jgi:regulator of nucleoside diphosphate kinase
VYFSARSFAKLESLARLELPDGDPVRDFFLRELDRGVVLGAGEMRGDVVEVGDRVAYRTNGSRTPENRRLSYPADLRPAADEISVLSPVGVALLGLREGSGMTFTTPDGTATRVHVVKVAPSSNRICQSPEARRGGSRTRASAVNPAL